MAGGFKSSSRSISSRRWRIWWWRCRVYGGGVGGGFGGSAIALVAQGQINEIKNAIADAFKSGSFAEPRFFTSLPSEGAKVVKQLVQ